MILYIMRVIFDSFVFRILNILNYIFYLGKSIAYSNLAFGFKLVVK
jgi:hypothetical protein